MGRNPGVYTSWEECEKQVDGYPDAKFKAFPSMELASIAFNDKWVNYWGKNSTEITSHFMDKSKRKERPIMNSISVDASCIGNPGGTVEYQSVNTGTRELIFHKGPYTNGTNNIGEFLAIVEAMKYLHTNQLSLPLYTDSKVAIRWVKNKKCNTWLKEVENNSIIFDLIRNAEKWLKENNYQIKIMKWKSELWGEIPADFNRK